jgi:predicted PurR-regulated permease PerM
MNSKEIAAGILRAVAILAGVAVLLFVLYKIQSVIVYVVAASVVSLLGRPLVIFLRRRFKFGNTLAVVVTMLFMVGLLLGIIAIFIPLIITQSNNLSLLNMEALRQNVEHLYKEVTDYFAANGIDVQETLLRVDIFSKLNVGFIPAFLNNFIGALGGFSVGLVSVLFISFFFLKDSRLLENGVMVFVPDNKELRLKKSIEKIKNLLSRYFLGLLLQIFILFVIYTVVLLVFGIDNAVPIAFLCALLNLIPYIGPLVGGALMLLLSMTSNLGEDFNTVILPTTLYVMIGFVGGQCIDNLVSQPLIFSNSVKSHPLEVFLVIIIGGLLFGITGMIVAVPFYTALKVMLKEFLAENKIVKALTKNI